ncbi:MAG: FAD-dependent oxidoreductase, partial [candidate division Zixibacteria bacterium]|nr:FAD-dependent oxidoreductase [candidate division Zixibacteria bacterium]
NIPSFRLPEKVLQEECDAILDMGVDIRYNSPVKSMKTLLDQKFDAVFVGSGAPRGKDLELPGRQEAAANIHIGIDWLESIAFGHIDKIGEKVLIIGVGNTAMDCCRSSRRLGGKDIKVMARRPRGFFKASSWELEDAEEEGIEIVINHSPKRFVMENGKLVGMEFERLEWDAEAKLSKIIDTVILPCDDVILAIGQEAAFPWIERNVGIEFGKYELPVVDEKTFMSTRPGVFFGGDAAWGPKNIIWAVAHGHEAAISIHQFVHGQPVTNRPPHGMNLISQKMGLSEWSYSNDFNPVHRQKMSHVDLKKRFSELAIEVELGFTAEQTAREVERCLNCDIQTVFEAPRCIECDACIDVCPVQCLTIAPNGEEADLKSRLSAPFANPEQALFVSEDLPQTKRVMLKDEDICVHCGLCAERCPTAAWDMQKSDVILPYAQTLKWTSEPLPV